MPFLDQVANDIATLYVILASKLTAFTTIHDVLSELWNFINKTWSCNSVNPPFSLENYYQKTTRVQFIKRYRSHRQS